MIRLIVDARQANRYHTRPPHCQGVRQRCLASICLTSVFCRHLGSGTLLRLTSVALGAMSVMVSINSRTIALLITSRCSSRFELATSESPKSTTQRLTGSHRSGCGPTIRCGRLLRALEHVVRITDIGRDLARERCEAPLMTVVEPVCSVYVDNINVHDVSLESCDRRREVIIAALEARGFSLHEISRASQQHKQ